MEIENCFEDDEYVNCLHIWTQVSLHINHITWVERSIHAVAKLDVGCYATSLKDYGTNARPFHRALCNSIHSHYPHLPTFACLPSCHGSNLATKNSYSRCRMIDREKREEEKGDPVTSNRMDPTNTPFLPNCCRE